MKKYKFALTSLLLITALATGCAEGTETTPSSNGAVSNNANSQTEQTATNTNAEDIELTFWHYYSGGTQESLDAIIDEFNKTIGKENKVTIKGVSQSTIYNLQEAISQSSEGVVYADSMPDIFLSYADKALELVEKDILCDFNDYFTDEDKAGFVPSFLEEGVIKDGQFIIPLVKSTELLYLNDTHWQEFATTAGYGYDDLSTWEKIYDVSKAYYEYTDALTPDVLYDGKSLLGIDSMSNYVMVSSMQMGTDIIDDVNEKVILDKDALYKSFSYYANSVARGYLTSVGKFRSDDVRSGDILGYTGSSASLEYFPTWVERSGEKVDIDWEAIAYPTFEGAEVYVCSQGAGLCATKTTPEKEAAVALFVKYLTSTDVNVELALKTEYLPIKTEFYETAYMSENVTELYAASTEEEIEDKLDLYSSLIDQFETYKLYASGIFLNSHIVREQLSNAYSDYALEIKAEVSKTPDMSDSDLANLIDAEFEDLLVFVENLLQGLTVQYK